MSAALTTISVSAETHERLRAYSLAHDVTMASVVELVCADLDRPPPERAAYKSSSVRLRDPDGDTATLRLTRAAVRMADVLETLEGPETASDGYLKRCMAADEELREASLALARSLSPRTRKRLGR